MDKKNQNLISLIVLGLVVLAVGVWLLFRYLPKKETVTNNADSEVADKIANIKRLAEQDLTFFPLAGDNVLKKLEKSGQYQGLTLNLDTRIDLFNPGNPFPFGVALESLLVEQ